MTTISGSKPESYRAKLFRSNRSQAVRIPKPIAFPDSVEEVLIIRDGENRLILPANARWTSFFAAPGFDLGDREQPVDEERDFD